MEIRLRDRRGRRASRWRCVLRAAIPPFVAVAPYLCLIAGPWNLSLIPSVIADSTCLLILLLAFATNFVWGIQSPSQTFVDRIARTALVPK